MDWTVISRNIDFLLGGLVVTFQLAVISLAGGIFFGVLLGLARISSRKYISCPATLYIHFFRSQPLILVIFWFYFFVPILFGKPMSAFISAIIGFIAFETAYFAEIIRGGIQSISKGQMQAAYATGMKHHQVMRYIVLPQALKNMLPSLMTQSIVLFQDTSLAYVIGLQEFLRRTSLVDSREVKSIELYLFSALVYLVICLTMSLFVRRFENKVHQGV
ncbi:MAG: amino acid ABC transporter permease [Desulfovibrionales bacterium]|nr:amino acid ABC transporter permease [Desulfovibrionales bacterium]